MRKDEIRPLIKYHGGKGRLWKWIVNFIPKSQIYVEPFGGAASILLNKVPSELEYYFDLEPRIVNLMQVVKNDYINFFDVVGKTEYNKENYLKFKSQYFDNNFFNLSNLDQAIITYITRRMSRGGLCGTFCWSSRLYSGVPAEISCWNTALPNIKLVSERLQNVIIERKNALEVIEKYDSEDTVFYLDPPYIHSTRFSKDLYLCEMTDKDHNDLLDLIVNLKGKVILSGYHSDLYQERLKGWWLARREVANHSSHLEVKDKKTELLYCNF